MPLPPYKTRKSVAEEIQKQQPIPSSQSKRQVKERLKNSC